MCVLLITGRLLSPLCNILGVFFPAHDLNLSLLRSQSHLHHGTDDVIAMDTDAALMFREILLLVTRKGAK